MRSTALAVAALAGWSAFAGTNLLAQQPPLGTVEKEDRLRQFKQHFGEDLAPLETEFLRYMRGVN